MSAAATLASDGECYIRKTHIQVYVDDVVRNNNKYGEHRRTV